MNRGVKTKEERQGAADPRPGGLARGDARPHAGPDPRGRPRDDRGAEMEEAVECDGGGPGLVAPRDCLHRGGVHGGREAHVRPGGQDPRPIAPLQFQPGRQHAKGDRHPRRGEGRRARVQGAREGRGGPEWPGREGRREGKARCGKRLDALIVRNVPKVRKAVKWNSPFYGIEGQGWFLGFHTFTHYVKVTFFRGTLLRPVPAGGTDKD